MSCRAEIFGLFRKVFFLRRLTIMPPTIKPFFAQIKSSFSLSGLAGISRNGSPRFRVSRFENTHILWREWEKPVGPPPWPDPPKVYVECQNMQQSDRVSKKQACKSRL